MKQLLASLALAMGGGLAVTPALASCSTDSTAVGTVKATAVGIEVRAGCTYVLVKDVSTTLPELDTNPFVAGRFAYLALDPADADYKAMLAIASIASAQGSRIYAEVIGRLGRVTRLSIAREEN